MDICRICLALDIKVYKLKNNEAKSFIENIFMQNGFNQELQETQFICFECKALLDKSYKFIKRVLKAQEILYDILKEKKAITPERLKKIDRRVTGFILVKDFKNIDLYMREEDNNNTKNNILKNDHADECEVKMNDALAEEDILENPDDDAFELDILKDDIYLETSSELDVKDFIGKISTEEKLDVSFVDFEVMNCELEETKLADASTRINNKKPKKVNLNKKKHKKRYVPSTEENDELFEYDGTEDSNEPPQLMTPDYPVKCDHCSYKVPNRLAHFRHYQWEHQDKKYPYARKTGKIFICKFCGHASKKKCHHIDHERTHSDVPNFTCPQCSKTFLTRAQLLKHIYRTHPAQMLECDYCGKKVKSRGSIMIHMRIHTGERPFKCPICGAGFAHRGNIRSHIRTKHNTVPNNK